MTNSELLDRLDHDLAAAIRNFQVADGLLVGTKPDVPTAAELLRASIEQLETMRKGLGQLGLNQELETKPSTDAQKRRGE